MEYKRHIRKNEISQLWENYLPYWPFFLILIILFTLAAWFYNNTRQPVYEAWTTLLIKDERKGSEDSKMEESLKFLSGKKIIENEIEILKSRKLASQVVQKLKLYAPVFEKGRWNSLPLYTNSPISIEAQQPDLVTEVCNVPISIDSESKNVRVAGRNYPLNQWVSTPWGKLNFTSNNKLYNPVKEYHFSLVSPKKVSLGLIDNLDISSANKLSSVLYLKLKDPVPQRAENILDALVDAYERASINDKNSLATNTLSFLDERLVAMSRNLDSIEKALQQYRAKKGAIDLSAQGRLFLEHVSNNDQKLSDVNMKLTVLGQVEESLFAGQEKRGFVPTNLGADEPVLNNLLNTLYDLELKYEKLRMTNGENSPETIAMADQIQKIKPNIRDYIRSKRQSLEVSKANLHVTNNNYNAMLQSLPQQERDLVEISRQKAIKNNIYSYLLQKREEAALSHSSTVSDSQIVDKAQASFVPTGISSKVVYAIAILVAIVLGVGLISAREFFSNKVLYRQELEAATSFPVLGEVAYVKSKTPMVIREGERTFVAEQFRLLRTSLPYLGINGRGKKILVTSTIPGEGKSFVALNLAQSLAIAGKKVVLLEFDLSNPTLGARLELNQDMGVADFLSGDAEPEEIISRTTAHENLFIIPAGHLPPNPSELIVKGPTEALLDHLKDIFDYVVVDCAPIGLLSDGYVLSRSCDTTLYIVRHGYTPKKVLDRLEANNKVHELKNIALVFNGIRSKGFAGNYYGYGLEYTYWDNYGRKRGRNEKHV